MKKWISLLLALVFVLGLGSTAMAAEVAPVGTIAGNTYNNGALGVSMVLPDNWRFFSDAELADQMGYGSQYASRQGLAGLLEQRSSVCAMYAVATSDATWNANLTVQDLGIYRSLDEQTLLDLSQNGIIQALEAQGFTNVQLTKATFALADQDRAGATLTANLGFIQTNMIVVLVKGDRYMGTLTVAASTREKAEEVLSFFEPLQETIGSEAATSSSASAVHDQIAAAIASKDWETALELLDGADGQSYPDYANVRQDCFNHANYDKAKQAMEDKLYYTAYTLFSEMGNYQDAASLAAKCKRPMPDTGEMSRNSDYKRQTCRLNLKNQLKGGYNIYVRIYDSTGNTFVSSTFIRSGKGAVIYLPEDNYLVKAAYGKGTWFGELEMFGDDAIYKALFTASLTNAGWRGTWYYNFEDELNGTTITREEF